MFKMQFDTDNDAFQLDSGHREAARILRAAADMLEGFSHDNGKCRDSNGNIVGEWLLT